MAEHTKAHLWINTIIAVCAFGAAAGNALFNWRAFDLKSEALDFTSLFSYRCRLEFVKLGPAGELGLCWEVTITNKSEARTPIINHQAFSVLQGGLSYTSGFTEIEDSQGRPVPFPVILDSGDAKPYLMRAPASIPESVVKIIEALPSDKPLTMIDLKNAVSKANLDIIGNQVDVGGPSGQTITFKPGFRTAIAQINFTTGRGNTFIASLRYPPGT